MASEQAILDATLRILMEGGFAGVDVALWGKNLLDQEYELTAIDNLPQADRAVIWGDPPPIGLDVIYRFRP